MRKWIISPAMLMGAAFAATLVVPEPCSGQQGKEVPVTITISPKFHGVSKVAFPYLSIDTFELADVGDLRVQYLVGSLPPDPPDERYRFEVEQWVGSSPNGKRQVISFAPSSVCTYDAGTGQTEIWSEGDLERIACSLTENGIGVTCMAFYDKMGAQPPAVCVGTHACLRCDGTKVCGSDPRCD